MNAQIYNQEGKEVGAIDLPSSVFGGTWNADLVHQVVTIQQGNARAGTADSKDRAEVRGGGKKPWKQKGTGKARHGSIRSPIWVGGGVTHGPKKEKIYTRTITKKMRNAALRSVLSVKAKDGEIILLDKFNVTEPKTKLAQATLTALALATKYRALIYKNGKRVLLITAQRNINMEKSFGNIKVASVQEARNLNPLDALSYRYLMFIEPEKVFEELTKRVKSKS